MSPGHILESERLTCLWPLHKQTMCLWPQPLPLLLNDAQKAPGEIQGSLTGRADKGHTYVDLAGQPCRAARKFPAPAHPAVNRADGTHHQHWEKQSSACLPQLLGLCGLYSSKVSHHPMANIQNRETPNAGEGAGRWQSHPVTVEGKRGQPLGKQPLEKSGSFSRYYTCTSQTTQQ